MRWISPCPANCGISVGCAACRQDDLGNFRVGDPITPPGWECPKCKKVYAPDVKECTQCNWGITCGWDPYRVLLPVSTGTTLAPSSSMSLSMAISMSWLK